MVDDDVQHFLVSAVESPQTAAAPFSVTIAARNIDGEVIPVFTNSVSLSVSGGMGPVSVSPAATGPFSNGWWTGDVKIDGVGTNMVLTPFDVSGAEGDSNPFKLVPVFEWSEVISPQTAGVPFAVAITARDFEGATASNFTGVVDLRCWMPDRLLGADLEAGMGSFVISNTYGAGDGLWHRTTGRSADTNHTAVYSLYYGQGEGPGGGGDYDAGYTEGVVVSTNIDLSGAQPPVMLSFKYMLETESDPDYDLATVEVSENGGPFQVVAGNKSGGVVLVDPTTNGWEAAAIDLSSYIGSSIRIRFHFNTVDRNSNAFEGWYLDDILMVSGGIVAVPISPTVSGSFQSGVWTGTVTALAGAVDAYLTVDWDGDALSQCNLFDVEGTDFQLEIVSAHDAVIPAAGTNVVAYGSVVACVVTNALLGDATTRHVYTGWTLLGHTDTNGLSSGSGTNVTLILTNDAVLTWEWRTDHMLVVQTNGSGTVAGDAGWCVAGSNVALTATAAQYWHFMPWTGDTNAITVGDANSETVAVAMAGPVSLSANFLENLAPMGTPEWWLASHGLTNGTLAQEELADTDGDGMSAYKEYVADTVPTNADSVLRITGLAPGSSDCSVRWLGGEWAVQYLERRRSLTSTGEVWVTIHTNSPQTTVTNVFSDVTATNGLLFYRIRVERP